MKLNPLPRPSQELEYFGKQTVMSGQQAVITMESIISEGFHCASAVNLPQSNLFGRELHHQALPVQSCSYAAGLNFSGLRSAVFCQGSELLSMHHQLSSAARKKLSFVVHWTNQSMESRLLSHETGHNFYHSVADMGLIQFFASNVQEALDYTLIAHRVAEQALIPCIVATDAFPTAFSLQSVDFPEKEHIIEFLGDSDDWIDAPTPSQTMVFGKQRRRIPNWFSLDHPTLNGPLKGPQALSFEIAAQRPYFLDHVPQIIVSAFEDFQRLTGRSYHPVESYFMEGADYIIITQGAVTMQVLSALEELRQKQDLKVGLIKLNMFRPFPGAMLAGMMAGRKGATIFESLVQTMTPDPPVFRECSATMARTLENSLHGGSIYPNYPAVTPDKLPRLYSARYPVGVTALTRNHILSAVDNMQKEKPVPRYFLGVDFIRNEASYPKQEILFQTIKRNYPELKSLTVDVTPHEMKTSDRVRTMGVCLSSSPSILMSEMEPLCSILKETHGYQIHGHLNTEYPEKGAHYLLGLAPDTFPRSLEDYSVNIMFATVKSLIYAGKFLERMEEFGSLVFLSEGNTESELHGLPEEIQNTIRKKHLNLYFLPVGDTQDLSPESRARLQTAYMTGAMLQFLSSGANSSSDRILDKIQRYYYKHYDSTSSQLKRRLNAIAHGLSSTTKLGEFPEKQDDFPEHSEPAALLRAYQDKGPGYSRLSGFFDHVSSFYRDGDKEVLVAEPYQAVPAIPAASAGFHDQYRKRHIMPCIDKKACTGCGNCMIYCPQTAMPAIALHPETLINAGVDMASKAGQQITAIFPAVKNLAKYINRQISENDSITKFSDAAIPAFKALAAQMNLDEEKQAAMKSDLDAILSRIGNFTFSKTDALFHANEKERKGLGELFSVIVDPRACTGCGLCANVCSEHAITLHPQTAEDIRSAEQEMKLWENLPDTPAETIERLLTQKDYNPLAANYLSRNFCMSLIGGYSHTSGTAEAIALHSLTTVLEAHTQPHVFTALHELNSLCEQLSSLIHKELSKAVPSEKFEGIEQTLKTLNSQESTVSFSEFINKLSENEQTATVNLESLQRKVELLKSLQSLAWTLKEGPTGLGRARFAGTLADSVNLNWAKSFPDNPFLFPVIAQWDNKSPDMTLGLFYGHMRHILDNLRLLRRAKLEVKEQYDPYTHDKEIAKLSWEELTSEEKKIFPPLLLIGDKLSLSDEHLSSLSRLLSQKYPIKVVLFANTNPKDHSSPALRLQGALKLAKMAIAHPKAFFLQSTLTAHNHLYHGLKDAFSHDGPALIHIYAPDPLRHGFPSSHIPFVSQLALNSRIFPCVKFSPEGNGAIATGFSLSGNPMLDKSYINWEIPPEKGSNAKPILEPISYAHWAAFQEQYALWFHELPEGESRAVTLSKYLEMNESARKFKLPYITVLAPGGKPKKFIIDDELVEACILTQDNWNSLLELSGLQSSIVDKLKKESYSEAEKEMQVQIDKLKSELEQEKQQFEQEKMQVVKSQLRSKLLSLSDLGKYRKSDTSGSESQ